MVVAHGQDLRSGPLEMFQATPQHIAFAQLGMLDKDPSPIGIGQRVRHRLDRLSDFTTKAIRLPIPLIHEKCGSHFPYVDMTGLVAMNPVRLARPD